MSAKPLLDYFSALEDYRQARKAVWVMDAVSHDDIMRLRTDHGRANMAIIRHTALNLIRAIRDKASLKIRRKTVGWDDDYRFNAITQSWI